MGMKPEGNEATEYYLCAEDIAIILNFIKDKPPGTYFKPSFAD